MDATLAQALSLIASGIFMVLMAIAAYINAKAKTIPPPKKKKRRHEDDDYEDDDEEES